ncbi:MAG: hypothetical protein EAZ44_01495 [Cytophagia bacterium]|nr:MAG: hypothetical protein EAY69_02075 [Cytophagales bacterium]TAG06835.1 MAG: hypothetical protein EAZ44_01495 [Cytophagia bacterium]TAG43506.1 MAG: hypothetical protein EAZ31_04135 [Cytophagia bacterium]
MKFLHTDNADFTDFGRFFFVSVKILYINKNGEIFVLCPRLCLTSESCNKQVLYQITACGTQAGAIGCVNIYIGKWFWDKACHSD